MILCMNFWANSQSFVCQAWSSITNNKFMRVRAFGGVWFLITPVDLWHSKWQIDITFDSNYNNSDNNKRIIEKC